MLPEEKANELIRKFMQYADYISVPKQSELGQLYSTIYNVENARQCALVCVDEIIDFISEDPYYKDFDFWQQVKKSIEEKH